MRTIERNYRKHPHTASFLKAFHTGGNGLAADAPAPVEEPDTISAYSFGAVNEAQAEDLLDEVPVDAPPADLRSPAQANLMTSLIAQITGLDEALGRAAGEWTAKATAAGHWTPGREGTASAWISRMITKVSELKASTKAPTAPAVAVADGRYAVEEAGVLKFFKVKNGRRFVFLDVQASDDWHRVHYSRTPKILALIAVDPKAAMIRYGQEIGECGHCGRTLTDAASRAAGIGPICASK